MPRAPKPPQTAIIVNSRGEVFIGWRSGCVIAAWGGETYYLSAEFQKPRTIIRTANEFWPWSGRRIYRNIGKPYVFSDRRSAEKALSKMGALGRAVVS